MSKNKVSSPPARRVALFRDTDSERSDDETLQPKRIWAKQEDAYEFEAEIIKKPKGSSQKRKTETKPTISTNKKKSKKLSATTTQGNASNESREDSMPQTRKLQALEQTVADLQEQLEFQKEMYEDIVDREMQAKQHLKETVTDLQEQLEEQKVMYEDIVDREMQAKQHLKRTANDLLEQLRTQKELREDFIPQTGKIQKLEQTVADLQMKLEAQQGMYEGIRDFDIEANRHLEETVFDLQQQLQKEKELREVPKPQTDKIQALEKSLAELAKIAGTESEEKLRWVHTAIDLKEQLQSQKEMFEARLENRHQR